MNVIYLQHIQTIEDDMHQLQISAINTYFGMRES